MGRDEKQEDNNRARPQTRCLCDRLKNIVITPEMMFPRLRSLPYETRLQQLGLWSPEEKRNRADMIKLFKMTKELSSSPWSPFLKRLKIHEPLGNW